MLELAPAERETLRADLYRMIADWQDAGECWSAI